MKTEITIRKIQLTIDGKLDNNLIPIVEGSLHDLRFSMLKRPTSSTVCRI